MPTIYVGNPKNIPLSGGSPANQVRPTNSNTGSELFTYKSYSPQWTGGAGAGGMYLLVLYRSDLS